MNPPAPTPEGPIIPTPHDARPVRWGRWVGGTLLLLVIAAVGAHWLWGRRAAKRLEAQVAAYRAAGEPVTVEDLNSWRDAVSGAGSGENAVAILRAAGGAVDEQAPGYAAYRANYDPLLLPLTDTEVAMLDAMVNENPAALRAVDDAATKTRIDWALDLTSPMFQSMGTGTSQDLTKLRRLTNLAYADALLARQRGDDARALRRARQILFISGATGHHPTLIGYLVSVGMSAQAAFLAAELAPELDLTPVDARRQAQSLVAELLDERPLAEARRRGLLGERVLQLDTVASLAQGRLQSGSPGVGKLTSFGWLMRPMFLEDGHIMAAHMTDMVRVLPQSPDWPTYQAKAPPSPKDGGGFNRHLLVGMLLPSLDRAVMVYYRNLTERRLAATCLAARLYAADHGGEFPGALQDLVPSHLPAVPLDPFAAGGTALSYVSESADAKDPRVYGVGENGIDNGGVEVDPSAPRAQTEKLTDEIRHLKRQPRPEPPKLETSPGPYPGMAPPGFPGAPTWPSEESGDWDLEEGGMPQSPDFGAGPPPGNPDGNP